MHDKICYTQVFLDGGRMPVKHDFKIIDDEHFKKRCARCGFVSHVKYEKKIASWMQR